MRILLALVLFAVALPLQAEDSGNALWITDSGLVVGKSDAQGIGDAWTIAKNINGSGWNPTTSPFPVIVGIHDNTGITDSVVVPVASVSPGTVSNAGGSPPHMDEWGNLSTNTPSQSHWDGSYGTMTKLNGSPLNCDAPPSNPTTTINCPAGQVVVGCISGCDTNTYLASNGQPWWHPNWCNCGGSCSPGSSGCPYTSGSPCVNSAHPGDGTTDCFQTWRICSCAAPNSTATSSPFPNVSPGNPAGSFQPSPIPSGDTSLRTTMLSDFSSALAKIAAMPYPTNNASGPVAAAVTIINNAITNLTSGQGLTAGQYAYAPGVVPCSTCAAVATSSGPTNNVWITNPELHVIVDNQPTSTNTFNISIGSVSLVDGTALSVDTVSVWSSSMTLASVYADFVATRSSSPLFNMLSTFGGIVSVSSGTTYSTVLSFTTSHWGTFTYDMNSGGYFSLLISMMFWAVQAMAVVSAYFIIFG